MDVWTRQRTHWKIYKQISRDNVSEPHAYLMESDSKETNSSIQEEEDVELNTQVFIFC
jgi:hypothetical protein